MNEGMINQPEPRPLVAAATYRQFDYARGSRLIPENSRHIRRAEQLYGRRGGTLIVLLPWLDNRRTEVELFRTARTCGMTITEVQT